MFERLAVEYYNEEEISDTLQSKIEECYHRAEAFMSSEVKYIIDTTYSFHDWYLTECSIYCGHGGKNCRLTLSKGCMTYCVLFSGVGFLSVVGKLVSDEANYPKSKQNSSLAQILALWLDYQNTFEICLLLDNERFVTIQANDFSIN